MNYRQVSENMLDLVSHQYSIQNSTNSIKSHPLTMNREKREKYSKRGKTRSKWYLHNSENFGSI